MLGRGQVDGISFARVLEYGEKVGKGEVFTYTIYIEPSIKIDHEKFTAQVEAILADKRGWTRTGQYAFHRVPKRAGTQMILARPATVDRLCAPLKTEGEVSCCNGSKVVINLERWQHGVEHWTGTLKTYRQMLVNHEMGHRIGKSHRWCPKAGEPAPVMQQQTYGLQGCQANPWPLNDEL